MKTYTQDQTADRIGVSDRQVRNYNPAELFERGYIKLDTKPICYIDINDLSSSSLSLDKSNLADVKLKGDMLDNALKEQKLDYIINAQLNIHEDKIKEQFINPLIQQVRIAISKCNLSTEQIDTFNKFMPECPNFGESAESSSPQQ